MDKKEEQDKAKDVQVGHLLREMTETEGWKLFLDIVSQETLRLNDLRQVDHNESKDKIAAEIKGRKYAIDILLGLTKQVDALIDQGKVSDEELKDEVK